MNATAVAIVLTAVVVFGSKSGKCAPPGDGVVLSDEQLVDRVVLKERLELPYELEFTSESGDLFGVREKNSDGRESRLFVRRGQRFFGRYSVIEFAHEKKFVPKIAVMRDVGVLTIWDEQTGKRFRLVQRERMSLPVILGIFRFRSDGKEEFPFQVARGRVFEFPGHPSASSRK